MLTVKVLMWVPESLEISGLWVDGPVTYDCNQHGYPRYCQWEVTIEEAQRLQKVMWDKGYHPLNHADICVARSQEKRYGEILDLTNSTPMVPRYRTAEDQKVAQRAYRKTKK